MSKVYLETTLISYYAARPSIDPIRAAHQLITRQWWEERRAVFDVYVSNLVIAEISKGDPEAARDRLAVVQGITMLTVTDEALALAEWLVTERLVPQKAAADAAHIAVAAVNGMDYLLTWNCTHIANAEMKRDIEHACEDKGYQAPILCTPEELMGGETDVA